MQETQSETKAAPGAMVIGDRPIYGRGLWGSDRQQVPDIVAARPRQNTQCFICSRIYFDQTLRKCPHCNSDSLQHYTTDDLNHFARDPV
jgi:hypothetical protein